MKTCKECIHYGICRLDVYFVHANNGDTYQCQDSDKVEEDCEAFTDKSEWIHLPCKVGDTMFITIGDSIIRYEIKRFEIDDLMIWAKGVNNDYAGDVRTVTRCISFDLGKTIFLSEEEAKKALADRRKGR